ncbi:hypothetical protein HNQ71_006536 [Mesorhizobium sangaii]|uniref:Uncharacterized protein n=1 Tax=Mesorhizobium sangaii TaxID=505389 RepID=A0A841PF52_9HYPH|nr:hypothetical protein [Mesorhizobium sangaii]
MARLTDPCIIIISPCAGCGEAATAAIAIVPARVAAFRCHRIRCGIGHSFNDDQLANAAALRRAFDRDDHVDRLAMMSGIGFELTSAVSCSKRVNAEGELFAWIVAMPPGWPVFQALTSASVAPS